MSVPYTDPPEGWAYNPDTGTAYLERGEGGLPSGSPRPAYVRDTPMGPQVVDALPQGWRYDFDGRLVYDDANGGVWTITEDDEVAKVTYDGDSLRETAFRFAPGIPDKTSTATPVTQKQIDNDEVPENLINKNYRAAVRAAIDKSAAAADQDRAGVFGVSGPGSRNADNVPADLGGTLNAEDWIGAEGVAEGLAAMGYGRDEIKAALQSYSTKSYLPESTKFYDQKTQEGTYYQRYAIEKAQSRGFGRPQYVPGDEFTVIQNMTDFERINLQQQLIAADIPGASTIKLGKIGILSGEDPTIVAYRNALSGANIAGVPIQSYLKSQTAIATALKKAEDRADGTTEKFDPVQVDKIVNLTGRGTARDILRQMMTNMLGRAPKESEVNAYVDRLNAREKDDPSIRTTTYTRDGDSSTVTEESDVDPTLIAERQIKKENPKQYRKNQELNYYNAMLQMMDGV